MQIRTILWSSCKSLRFNINSKRGGGSTSSSDEWTSPMNKETRCEEQEKMSTGVLNYRWEIDCIIDKNKTKLETFASSVKIKRQNLTTDAQPL